MTPIEDFGMRMELPFKNLTNDEFQECCDFVEVMKFMREQSAPVPESNDELRPLLKAWIKYKRAELRVQVTKMLDQRRQEREFRPPTATIWCK
jgi:hypothetical protein